MWTSFFVYVAALVAVLFVPGYALLRCVGLDKTISLGFSPVVCIVLFCFLGCAFHEVGIASSSAVYIAVLVASCIGVACVKVGSGGVYFECGNSFFFCDEDFSVVCGIWGCCRIVYVFASSRWSGFSGADV